MIDIKLLRENPEKIKNAAQGKNITIDTSLILLKDEEYRKVMHEVQILREERNKVAKERNIERGKELKVLLSEKEPLLLSLEAEVKKLLSSIPSIAKDDVKVGKDDSENDVIRTVGEIPQFSFKIRDHLELGEILQGIDMERAAKVSGARFGYLKNDLVRLEFALVQFALETLIHEGFTPVVTPELIEEDTMRALGYTENGGDEDMFYIEKDRMFLVGTAEHALVPMHKNEVLRKSEFPMRYVGFSSAFRREAGSYGKDTRGIFRVHQFDKVEMVSFVGEGEDDREHEYFLSLEEKFFQALKIPYQVVKMCTGDLGFPIARKYDIEAWIPSQGKYREVTSASTATDFQARRLNIRYQEGIELKYANILNGTAFAIGRTIIAILENYQQEDGSVIVPEVLRSFMGGLETLNPRKQ